MATAKERKDARKAEAAAEAERQEKETKKANRVKAKAEKEAPEQESVLPRHAADEKKKRLAAKAGIGEGGGFEGVEKCEKTDIEGDEVILVDFRFGASKFKENTEYVTILIELDGEQRQVSIGGQVVVEGLHNINKEEDLPAPVIFLKKPTKDGKKTFWTME